ncbi:SRPBCC domain-containing protein [Rhizobium sp. KVB221]|uniref:SRPBCC domain-containing protein n=1 Tax=Rhizobium setariae TaxID=2801340 RepID=A0A936YQ62_9HYPH|nr:SRPBCC domain-containing protein [Rhizobium setariae]MBL0372461.1 SRPBCC domain-containing protein [Rhizobium setariae]
MNISEKLEAVEDRELVITRVYDAPARLLFLAYSRPEHMMRWFGPKGWPLTKCEMDFRVGGEFHFAMTSSEGEAGPPFGGKYLEIIPNKKIKYDNGFEEPGNGRMLVTVLFEEQDGKTTLTVSTVFDTAAMKKEYIGLGIEEGMNSGFDNLEELVAELKAVG